MLRPRPILTGEFNIMSNVDDINGFNEAKRDQFLSVN